MYLQSKFGTKVKKISNILSEKSSILKLLKFCLITMFTNVKSLFQVLGDNILYITRPNDKKQILFYNDKYCQFKIDEGL